MVSALYIDPRGPYPALLGPENCWSIERDARTYAGPGPIVAHPPCGPWGRLHHMYKGGEGGPELAILAVEQVRRWGGVLEHPKDSSLWWHEGLPRPGEHPDAFGGWTESINQCDWYHVTRKPTWIYCVRVNALLAGQRPTPREPTHSICNGRGQINGRKRATARQCKETPRPFAEWLVALASTAVRA